MNKRTKTGFARLLTGLDSRVNIYRIVKLTSIALICSSWTNVKLSKSDSLARCENMLDQGSTDPLWLVTQNVPILARDRQFGVFWNEFLLKALVKFLRFLIIGFTYIKLVQNGCFYPKVTIPMNSKYSIQIIFVQTLCLNMLVMTIDLTTLNGVIVI